MSAYLAAFDQLSDRDLLREVTGLAAREREATVCLIASLAELDRRQLYLGEGFASLFAYCQHALHLSEAATYDRITAARAARRFPVILEHLTKGTVTLTTIRLLAPHLTEANHAALLVEARDRTKREVEEIIARLHPRPDVPASVRKLPTPPPPRAAAALATSARAGKRPEPTRALAEAPAASAAPAETPLAPPASPPPRTPSPPRRAELAPLAPGRYKVSFTIDAETYAKLREAQDLLRHVIPDGDPAAIYDRALTALLAQLAKAKHAATERPSTSAGRPERAEGRPRQGGGPAPGSRRIPADVQRRVWERDGGQCTFMSPSGRRCHQRGWLEFHQTVPFAVGGEASVDGIRLLCRAHNQYQAARDFGPWDRRHVRDRQGTDGSSHDGTRASTSSPGSRERDHAPLTDRDEDAVKAGTRKTDRSGRRLAGAPSVLLPPGNAHSPPCGKVH